MEAKYSVLLATLLVGAFASPVIHDDMSVFFDHTVSDTEGRIIGGSNAPEGSWPWMVGLSNGVLSRSFLCGGSLVSNRRILTAAHCVNAVFSGNSLSNSLRAHVGTNRWNSGGQTYQLQRNITHPNYVQQTIRNDISLLVTSANVVMNNRVRVVPLNYNWVGAGVPCSVAGWGRTRTGGSLSNTLLQLNVNTVDGNFCRTEVARVAQAISIRNAPTVEPHIELCTFAALNVGTCNGDSGSPLILRSNSQQVGIVSWGLPCARGAPDMFVRVSAFRNWLVSSM